MKSIHVPAGNTMANNIFNCNQLIQNATEAFVMELVNSLDVKTNIQSNDGVRL